MMLHPSYEENFFRLSGGINGGETSKVYTAAFAKETPADLVPELSEDLVLNMYVLTTVLATLNLEMSVMSASMAIHSSSVMGTAGGVVDALWGVYCSGDALYAVRDRVIEYEMGDNLAGYKVMDLMIKQIMAFVWGIFSMASNYMAKPISDAVMHANLVLDALEYTVDFDPQALLIAAAGTLKELASDEQSSSEISYLVQQIMNPATGIPSLMKQMRSYLTRKK